MSYTRYNKEELAKLVSECSNYSEVCRRLGKKPVGGTIHHMGLMCKRWGIDTTHMSRSSPTKGKRSTKRKPAHERLVMGNPTDHRVKPYTLRCAMFDSGFDYKCNICGIDEWQGHKIGLEVDHKDEQYWNNTLENLQFLCPNCHSMKNKLL